MQLINQWMACNTCSGVDTPGAASKYWVPELGRAVTRQSPSSLNRTSPQSRCRTCATTCLRNNVPGTCRHRCWHLGRSAACRCPQGCCCRWPLPVVLATVKTEDTPEMNLMPLMKWGSESEKTPRVTGTGCSFLFFWIDLCATWGQCSYSPITVILFCPVFSLVTSSFPGKDLVSQRECPWLQILRNHFWHIHYRPNDHWHPPWWCPPRSI